MIPRMIFMCARIVVCTSTRKPCHHGVFSTLPAGPPARRPATPPQLPLPPGPPARSHATPPRRPRPRAERGRPRFRGRPFPRPHPPPPRITQIYKLRTNFFLNICILYYVSLLCIMLLWSANLGQKNEGNK